MREAKKLKREGDSMERLDCEPVQHPAEEPAQVAEHDEPASVTMGEGEQHAPSTSYSVHEDRELEDDPDGDAEEEEEYNLMIVCCTEQQQKTSNKKPPGETNNVESPAKTSRRNKQRRITSANEHNQVDKFFYSCVRQVLHRHIMQTIAIFFPLSNFS